MASTALGTDVLQGVPSQQVPRIPVAMGQRQVCICEELDSFSEVSHPVKLKKKKSHFKGNSS